MPFKRATNCANAPSTEKIISLFSPDVNTFFSFSCASCAKFDNRAEIWYNIRVKGSGHMKEFVPAEKMSKKAKKELAKKSRRLWEVSPVSRRIENKKHYNRKRKSHERYDNAGMGLVFFIC